MPRCICPNANAFRPEYEEDCPVHGVHECELDWCTEPAVDGETLCAEHLELEAYERKSEANADD